MCSAQVSPSDRSAGLTAPRWRVVSVQALQPHRLRVAFLDGTEGEIDLGELIQSADAGVFEGLRDPERFAAVRVEHGAVAWPDDLDLAPDALYAAIKAGIPFPMSTSR